MRWRAWLAIASALMSATVVSSCATSAVIARGETSVTVFGAASLAGAFGEIAKGYETQHPGVHVAFEFAGTPTLVMQIQQGARPDVFASADEANMQKLAGSSLDGTPRVFASNLLEIAVVPGNPLGIHSIADLARPGLVLSLAASDVPAGHYAREALTRAGVTVPSSVTQEESVAAVLSRVSLGEADAGIVYTTDVIAAGRKVQGIAIPWSQNVFAHYPIAVLKDAPHAVRAHEFVAYVLSDAGRAILARYGFGSP